MNPRFSTSTSKFAFDEHGHVGGTGAGAESEGAGADYSPARPRRMTRQPLLKTTLLDDDTLNGHAIDGAALARARGTTATKAQKKEKKADGEALVFAAWRCDRATARTSREAQPPPLALAACACAAGRARARHGAASSPHPLVAPCRDRRAQSSSSSTPAKRASARSA